MNVRRLSKLGAAALLILAAGCQRSPRSERSEAVTSEPTPAATTTAPFSSPPVLSGTPDVAALVARVGPSVVNITTEHEVEVPRDMPGDPFGSDSPFGWFFGPNRKGPPSEPFERGRKLRALGSGILIDAAGHVVTNAHVVENADVVHVKLADEREFKAKVKGRDPQLDLAVLELEGAKDLPAATLGSSAALRVGEYVIAIGNPFGLGHTVTMGIVSAKSRTIGAGPYDDFIQTDASINPGNSGGPLFNLRGEVVGINTAINPSGKGIGFAIPIDDVKDVLPQLLGTGHVARGRLGVVIQPVDAGLAKAFGLDRPRGALVAEVESDGPASKAGLQSGDVIVELDGAPVSNSHDLPRLVARHAPGSKVKMQVLRKGETKTFEATLDTLADNEGKGETPSAPSVDSSGLGAELMDAPDRGGAVVRRVRPGSPADEALEPGDVIVEVDRAPVKNAAEASEQMGRALKKGPALLRIEREGRGRYVVVEPGSQAPTSPR